MALWEVNGEIVYSDGSLSIKPSGPAKVFVSRHYYTVPFTNTGKGGILTTKTGTYHTPSWIKVHPQTTVEDIIVEKKPFEELFTEPKVWKIKSSDGKSEYEVKQKQNGELYCDCWGYRSHRKCKHITEVKNKI